MNAGLRLLFRAPVYLYRLGLGRLLGRRFVLLIHPGRRTGRRHETVLEVLEYRPIGPEIVVMSAFGPKADWLRNVQAASGAEVAIGTARFNVGCRLLDSSEAAAVMQRYEQRNRFAAPVVRVVLSRLLGWQYHGSEAERVRLVAQLPLVALFRRAGESACGSS